MALEGRWWTWANLMSATRFACIAPCVWAVLVDRWDIAAACFATAVVTDFLDGPIARRRGDASPLGGVIDHASDASFVAASLAAIAATGRITPWLPILVAAAFIQYTWDSKVLAGRSLRTSRLGRYNGIAYYVVAGIPIISEALRLGWPPVAWVAALAWLLVGTTLISMFDRARALRTAS